MFKRGTIWILNGYKRNFWHYYIWKANGKTIVWDLNVDRSGGMH